MACCFVYVTSVWFGPCSSPAVSAVSLYLVGSVVLPEDDPIEGLKHVGDILNPF